VKNQEKEGEEEINKEKSVESAWYIYKHGVCCVKRILSSSFDNMFSFSLCCLYKYIMLLIPCTSME
jgi:hypothetical protein